MSHNITRCNFLLVNGIVNWASKKNPIGNLFNRSKIYGNFLCYCKSNMFKKVVAQVGVSFRTLQSRKYWIDEERYPP